MSTLLATKTVVCTVLSNDDNSANCVSMCFCVTGNANSLVTFSWHIYSTGFF